MASGHTVTKNNLDNVRTKLHETFFFQLFQHVLAVNETFFSIYRLQ